MSEGSFVFLSLCLLKQLIQGVDFVSARCKLAILVSWLFLSLVESQVNLWLREKSQAADTKLPAQWEMGTDTSQSVSLPEQGP